MRKSNEEWARRIDETSPLGYDELLGFVAAIRREAREEFAEEIIAAFGKLEGYVVGHLGPRESTILTGSKSIRDLAQRGAVQVTREGRG